MLKSTIKLRPYQIKAIENWIASGYVGFFEMATGTGKTITSLNCAKYILDRERRINLLVLVPTLDLAIQWKHDVEKIICKNVILANSKNDNWYIEARAAICIQDRSSYCIIATYSTFLTKRFQFILNKMDSNSMLIADEAHNFGAKQYIKLYPKHIKRRLGLSATPRRHFDDIGTDTIMAFFNVFEKVTFSFSMKNAIQEGYLCDYYYYPMVVSLNEVELEEYLSISKKLVRFFHSGYLQDSPSVNALLLKRKRIIHNACGKFDCLRKILNILIEERKKLKYILVYVPEGSDKDSDDLDCKLINEYSRILSDEFNLSQHQFIGGTKGRDSILKKFSEGSIDVLTAMKCLDEGVDIKRAEIAIFGASTGNPRQFIQRRGRILRTHPDKRNAIIYDMIVIPSIDEENINSNVNSMERNMLRSELMRVREFASLALNQYQALSSLEEIANSYDLDIYSSI